MCGVCSVRGMPRASGIETAEFCGCMILKHKDDASLHLAELERLLKLPRLGRSQRKDVEDELWAVRLGNQGEKEAAYHLDFHWKNGLNSAIIHDLRIEHEGRTAQIDHLILTRSLNLHVLESKNFRREVRISKSGEWETRTHSGWRGIASPVEQNKRHIEVLKAYLRDRQLAPKRLGIPLPVRFQNWVLVSPQCQVRREGDDWSGVVRMDMFEKRFEEWAEGSGVLQTFTSLASFVSRATLQRMGQALVYAHQPTTYDYAGKLGLNPAAQTIPEILSRTSTAGCVCAACGAGIEARVVSYCRQNSERFAGRLLCRGCQSAPRLPACDLCSVEVEERVVIFCQSRSQRFDGRLLCRSCQAAGAAA